MKKLGLVIVDGVGFRNFILSDFVEEAAKEFSKITIYSGLPESAYKEHLPKDVEVVELPIFKESSSTWFWRKSKEVAHMQQHKKEFFGIKRNLEKNKAGSHSTRAWMTRLIFRFTAIFNSEKWIQHYYNKQIKSFKSDPVYKEYLQIFKKHPVDFLFFTHQRPPYLAPLVEAAKKNKVSTCSFIFSWDNLASKGRMAAEFDSFVVWSDLMKKELLYFYPKASVENVSVVGTPQFEPYVLPRYKTEKANFLNKFNLSAEKKTICYSCGDVSTSKNDGLYIETIAEAIEEGEIKAEVNFLVRTSPAEDGSRFSAIKKKYPFIIWNFPNWYLSRENHPEPWSQRIPKADDVRDLRAVLEYCDLGINMCSTMSLDFMLFGKPVINPVFGNGKNGLYNDQRYLEYNHYKKVVESGAVWISKNKKELVEAINEALENPKLKEEEQKALIELQVGKALEGTSKRVVKTLIEFSE